MRSSFLNQQDKFPEAVEQISLGNQTIKVPPPPPPRAAVGSITLHVERSAKLC